MNLHDSCAPQSEISSAHTEAFNNILNNGISSQRGVQVTPDTLRSDLAEDEERNTTITNTSLLPPIQIPSSSMTTNSTPDVFASLANRAQPSSMSPPQVKPSPRTGLSSKSASPQVAGSAASLLPHGNKKLTTTPIVGDHLSLPHHLAGNNNNNNNNSASSSSSSSSAPNSASATAALSKYNTPPPQDPSQDMSVVTPYLVKHISDQSMIPKDNFHKYCYRHNPDVTCNKTTDEAKMKKIQNQLEKLPSRDQEAISHVWSIFSAAPNQHRSLILQGLLSQCCFPQLSFVSQEVSQLIRIDFITTLPMEISLKILCYLDCNSLCNAAQVSRKWKSLADDDRVWHHMCEQHIDRKCPNCGWGLPLMHMKRAREFQSEDDQENKRRKQEDSNETPDDSDSMDPSSAGSSQPLAAAAAVAAAIGATGAAAPAAGGDATSTALAAPPKPKKRPWKSVYSERFKLEKNWRKGVHTIKTFNGHTDGVPCLQFNRKYLMTGSYDSTIKIWKVSTGECLKTLTGHTKGVRSLVFDSQKLITGSEDSTIKVWNYHTGQCISTYRGHDNAVISVDFCNKTIVSGSADHTVKVWHVDSRTCYTLRGHNDWVNSVKIHSPSNTVFSASDDTTIRMWDLENNQCLRIFGGFKNSGHKGQVQCVIPLIYKEKIDADKYSDSENEIIDSELLEREDGATLPRAGANGFGLDHNDQDEEDVVGTDEINEIQLPNNPNYPTHLLTSALDNTIKLWDVKTGKCIRTQFGHIEGVWSVSADTFRIISGSHDRLVKVWDLQSGKCLHTFGNSSRVNSVGLSDSRFCAGLDNGTVKMFCFD